MILAAGAGATAGPLGLLVVLLLGVATVLLIRNMNGRLKRLPPSFDDPTGPVDDPAAPAAPAALADAPAPPADAPPAPDPDSSPG
ncbi:MAG: hypothetical protein ABIO67_03565 [Mycobacteriales bacterium]